MRPNTVWRCTYHILPKSSKGTIPSGAGNQRFLMHFFSVIAESRAEVKEWHSSLFFDVIISCWEICAGPLWRLCPYWWDPARLKRRQCMGVCWPSTLMIQKISSRYHRISATGAVGMPFNPVVAHFQYFKLLRHWCAVHILFWMMDTWDTWFFEVRLDLAMDLHQVESCDSPNVLTYVYSNWTLCTTVIHLGLQLYDSDT